MVTGKVMVNPHYPVDVRRGTRYKIDSGAFQERDMLARLQPWTALDRQLRMEAQIEYGGHDGWAEDVVTYDMLAGVDEAIVDGQRVKRRGTEETAQQAVYETIRSARYYKTQEARIRGGIAYAAQGVTPTQYLECVKAILPLIRPERDALAFGGFCIIGMVPSLKPVFYATLDLVLPLLRDNGITRAHLLGVTVADAIEKAVQAERRYGVRLSTDSTGPERCAIFGRGYSNGRQVARYTKAQKYIDYHPATFAIENIRDYHTWMEAL